MNLSWHLNSLQCAKRSSCPLLDFAPAPAVLGEASASALFNMWTVRSGPAQIRSPVLARETQVGNNIYEGLVKGSALRMLDDGEAATIGYAHEVGGEQLSMSAKHVGCALKNFHI